MGSLGYGVERFGKCSENGFSNGMDRGLQTGFYKAFLTGLKGVLL